MSLNRVVVLSYNNSFASEAFVVIDDACLPCFIHHEILINFVY